MRDGREGRREPLSVMRATVQAEVLPPRVCGSRYRLPVLQGNLHGAAAGGRRRRHGADLPRQPLQCEDCATQCRRVRPREGRPRHRVSDRRARGTDRRRKVPRSEHSVHRNRDSAPRRDVLWREQLRGGIDRGAILWPLGQTTMAIARRRDRIDHARTCRRATPHAPDRHTGRHEGCVPGTRKRSGDVHRRRRQNGRYLRSGTTALTHEQVAPDAGGNNQ